MAAFSKEEEEIMLLEIQLQLLKMRKIRRRRLKRKLEKSRRKYWVRPIFQKREEFGVFKTLYPDLTADTELFFGYARMAVNRFDHLISLVTPSFLIMVVYV